MKTGFLNAALGFTALASAQGAAAQQACVEPDDLADALVYATPMLYDSVKSPCTAIFSQSQFMTNDADAFVEQFRAQRDASWDGTLSLLKIFIAADADQGGEPDPMAQAVAQLPSEALRPLADVILGGLIDERITSKIDNNTCADIAEAMELVAPLPLENLTGLALFLAGQADLKNPAICGTPQALAQ